MFKAFAAISFLFFAVLAAAPQTTKQSSTKKFPPLESVARSGWTTPVFAKDVFETSDDYPDVVEDIEIQRKRYVLRKEQIVKAEPCGAEAKSESPNYYAVRDYTIYEFRGRIFAYAVDYFGVALTETSRGYLGCMRKAIYADEDGDGTFELRCREIAGEFVPRWIKELKIAEMPQLTVARGGWSVPVFADDLQFKQNEPGELIEDVDVDVESYYFNKEKFAAFESCAAETENQAAQKQPAGFVIDGFTAYRTRDKIFAYRLVSRAQKSSNYLTGASIDSPESAPVGLNIYADFLYVDETGDGTFQRRCEGGKLRNLPQWVKGLGEIKVKIK